MPPEFPHIPAANRIPGAMWHTEYALRELRNTPSPGTLSHSLALIWRYRLGPAERCLLLAAAVQASDKEDVENLGFILGGPPPLVEVP